jgi:hypothetical protein
MNKQTLKGCLTLGAALGVVALTQPAQAADTTSSSSSSMAMSSQPMMVTGKVNNYWTDPSGYVTGVDIQTANGPAVVHFVPGMGNMLMQTYPIGSTANMWAQGSMQGGTQQWDLVGVGDKMPAAGFWPVMSQSGIDIAEDTPMIVNGAQRVTVEGKLRRVVVNQMGQVIGLAVETGMITGGTTLNHLGRTARGDMMWQSSGSMGGGAVAGGTSGGAMAGGATGGNWTLVRVGPEYRPAPSHGNMMRVTPLMVGDDIMATGYLEAPRYGALSPYSQRLISSAIVVNGQTVGLEGFPTMSTKDKPLFGFNINLPLITGKTPDTMQVVPGGYEVYSGSSGMAAK